MKAKIIGTGSYLPQKAVTNDDLTEFLDTSNEWIFSRTGICSRHISTDETVVFMACEAAKKALEKSHHAPEDIDLVLVATSSAEKVMPNTASAVCGELHCSNAAGMDLNAACSGFLYGLSAASAYIQSGMFQNILVIGAENMSNLVDWTDRSTCVLFGDGAGAAVLTSAETGINNCYLRSIGEKGAALLCDSRTISNPFTKKTGNPYVSMDGKEVFKFAVKEVSLAIDTLLTESHTPKESIQYVLLHQANKRIIESISKKTNISLEHFPMNLDHCGNTSAASLAILLDECASQNLFKPKDELILAGFGAGLTIGVLSLTW